MAGPVLVEVTRGPLVESRHRGALAIAGADGLARLALGDIDEPVYPRSAVKALQALPLVESGAADAFGLTEAEIALACASHSGEPQHVAAARSMLEKVGLDEGALACGAHPPRRQEDILALHAAGEAAGRVHNNCSGKHAGMLALARHMKIDTAGYNRPDHPVQRRVRACLSEMTGAELGENVRGTDGCSLPNWAMEPSALATGFARFATGEGLAKARAAACARIRRAVSSHPFMVAGTDRFCTTVMEAAPAVFVKTGAEGVFCAAFPESGLGAALKIEDGAARASQALMAAVVLAVAPLDDAARGAIAALARPVLRNWAGIEVGEIRVAESVAARLKDSDGISMAGLPGGR